MKGGAPNLKRQRIRWALGTATVVALIGISWLAFGKQPPVHVLLVTVATTRADRLECDRSKAGTTGTGITLGGERMSTEKLAKGRHYRSWVFITIVIFVAVPATILYGPGYLKTAEQLVEEGQVALGDGAFLQSANCAERAVAISPQLDSAWKLLAEAASRNGQVDRALEGLDQLARLSPASAGQLGLRLGSFWLQRNEVRPALRALQHAKN